MTLPAAEVVDVDSLWKTIVAAIAAGVGITVAFSLALLGWVRAEAAQRESRTGVVIAWGLVTVLGVAAVIGGIILGMIVMTDK